MTDNILFFNDYSEDEFKPCSGSEDKVLEYEKVCKANDIEINVFTTKIAMYELFDFLAGGVRHGANLFIEYDDDEMQELITKQR